MKHHLIALFSGVLFSLGLWISGMTDPQHIQGFLSLSAWQPQLMFVIIGALVLLMPFFYIVNRNKAVKAMTDQVPKNQAVVDRRLIVGALLFGTGWGLYGLCPGPAIASIVFLDSSGWAFLISMLLGMTFIPFGKRIIDRTLFQVDKTKP